MCDLKNNNNLAHFLDNFIYKVIYRKNTISTAASHVFLRCSFVGRGRRKNFPITISLPGVGRIWSPVEMINLPHNFAEGLKHPNTTYGPNYTTDNSFDAGP